ncbi:MAG TPA: M1 family metallopeptidase [Chitinophagales bacterium]|nr:M1 family metallopeptidase [Chitinophagales bacterium]
MPRAFVTAFAILTLFAQSAGAQSLLNQKKGYTRADTLRGALRPERTCYDVTYYELYVHIDTARHRITGSSKIAFKTVEDFNTMQIDLYANMKIINIVWNGKELRYRREFNAVFVEIPDRLKAGSTGEITVNYDGEPIVAKKPPWDGGFTWTYDKNGKFWLGVSCEGMGASLWWPCKDYLGDEPDSMRIICNVPAGLMAVCNGQLEKQVDRMDTTIVPPATNTTILTPTTTFYWKVTYPINNYNVTLNIADYAHFSDDYIAEDGSKLALNYYVMPYNLEKAKLQFAEVKPMLKCYEKYLGKYPFWNDGYKLVETPYLGMEHQSCIAYGNQYKTGYAGYDYSRIGLTFDYIIIHESAHEWWGNSISCKDLADMWIHESFATYTEAIYVECMFGKDTALKYINAKKSSVGNKGTIVGKYGVNEEGDGDMYNKGMLFLNTLRFIVNNDALWWDVIKDMCDTTFKYKNIGYDDVVNYFNHKTGRNLTAIFDQYLRHSKIPILNYTLKKKGGDKYELVYQWKTDETGFAMPFHITTQDGDIVINGTGTLQRTEIRLKSKTDLKIRTDLGYFDTGKL